MVEPHVLRIGLLSELSLRLGETPLPALESARAESLLAYLLLHRDAPVPRQRLAFLHGRIRGEAQARTNLRHVLHTLRPALPDSDRYLEVTARALRCDPTLRSGWISRRSRTRSNAMRCARPLTDTVRVLTGREPRSFAQFAHDHADAFPRVPATNRTV